MEWDTYHLLGCLAGLAAVVMDAVRSRATAGRSILFPLGHIEFQFVEIGNLLSARLILMLFICSWKGLRWIIEQPEGSAFPLQPRWQQFLKLASASCRLMATRQSKVQVIMSF